MQLAFKHTFAWNPWPASIIAFFTVAIIGCGAFIVFCNRHPADLVTADYYEQEVRYQRQIDRLQRAQERAQHAAVAYDAPRSLITICLPPRQSANNTTGVIQLYRPSDLSLDRALRLAPNSQGIQQIDAANLVPGLWKIRISWSADGQDYFLDKPVVIIARSSGS